MSTGTSKILQVPYFTQPTATSCQSTVLKMMAAYLENKVTLQTAPGGRKSIPDIKKDINHDPKRPDTKYENSHANFKWWLEQQFPSLKFNYVTTKDAIRATATIVKAIDLGFPVLVSVSHARVVGHIILVVGYEHYLPNASSKEFRWMVHDPYGQFDPSLMSDVYGTKRYSWGMSLLSGDEHGPGRNVALEPTSISRHRKGDASGGTYFMLYASK